MFWACPAEKGGPGYSFQVLALPSSGCGLFTSIPHANGLMRAFSVLKGSKSAQYCHCEERSNLIYKIKPVSNC